VHTKDRNQMWVLCLKISDAQTLSNYNSKDIFQNI
jgi:hypothetical protein